LIEDETASVSSDYQAMMKVTPARQALRIPVMGAENKKRFIAE
jgi:hypothetical protein